jgi:nucleotide-binding universal stress UspA family protein
MIRKILRGYDGSELADAAFAFALELAREFAAELHAIAVVRPPQFGDEVETRAVIENSRRHYEKVLGTLSERLAKQPVAFRSSLVVGHPAEQIVRYAEEHSIDHIVVGRRGRTLFERWLIGSVARQVIAYAHCAVTVVRK